MADGVNVWWTIHGQAILDALRQVQAGDDPDIVYAELYANTDRETPGAGDAR